MFIAAGPQGRDAELDQGNVGKDLNPSQKNSTYLIGVEYGLS